MICTISVEISLYMPIASISICYRYTLSALSTNVIQFYRSKLPYSVTLNDSVSVVAQILYIIKKLRCNITQRYNITISRHCREEL